MPSQKRSASGATRTTPTRQVRQRRSLADTPAAASSSPSPASSSSSSSSSPSPLPRCVSCACAATAAAATTSPCTAPAPPPERFSFWDDLPLELAERILSHAAMADVHNLRLAGVGAGSPHLHAMLRAVVRSRVPALACIMRAMNVDSFCQSFCEHPSHSSRASAGFDNTNPGRPLPGRRAAPSPAAPAPPSSSSSSPPTQSPTHAPPTVPSSPSSSSASPSRSHDANASNNNNNSNNNTNSNNDAPTHNHRDDASLPPAMRTRFRTKQRKAASTPSSSTAQSSGDTPPSTPTGRRRNDSPRSTPTRPAQNSSPSASRAPPSAPKKVRPASRLVDGTPVIVCQPDRKSRFRFATFLSTFHTEGVCCPDSYLPPRYPAISSTAQVVVAASSNSTASDPISDDVAPLPSDGSDRDRNEDNSDGSDATARTKSPTRPFLRRRRVSVRQYEAKHGWAPRPADLSSHMGVIHVNSLSDAVAQALAREVPRLWGLVVHGELNGTRVNAANNDQMVPSAATARISSKVAALQQLRALCIHTSVGEFPEAILKMPALVALGVVDMNMPSLPERLGEALPELRCFMACSAHQIPPPPSLFQTLRRHGIPAGVKRRVEEHFGGETDELVRMWLRAAVNVRMDLGVAARNREQPADGMEVDAVTE